MKSTEILDFFVLFFVLFCFVLLCFVLFCFLFISSDSCHKMMFLESLNNAFCIIFKLILHSREGISVNWHAVLATFISVTEIKRNQQVSNEGLCYYTNITCLYPHAKTAKNTVTRRLIMLTILSIINLVFNIRNDIHNNPFCNTTPCLSQQDWTSVSLKQ